MSNSLKTLKTAIEQSRTSSNLYRCKRSRCNLLTDSEEVMPNSNGILYWMQRDCRVQDNEAMLFAQRLATKAQVPLHVCAFGGLSPFNLSERQHKFFLGGLCEVAEELKPLNINFFVLDASASENHLLSLIEANNIGALICEFFPLREHRSIAEGLAAKVHEDFPIIQVDAHNVVPCLVASDKLEVGARTIRGKIMKKLDEFLHPFPLLSKHEFPVKDKLNLKDLNILNLKTKEQYDQKDLLVSPGYNEAVKMLNIFLQDKLKDYGSKRNDPCSELQSELSPYYHFGQISVQRVALEVKKYEKIHKEGVACYLEESIVRRELSDNFCYYNENYDNILGAAQWAQETLKLHNEDKRTYVYSEESFTKGKTHEALWNAAQNQLVHTGRLHGYMRMYWAKKILEWTPSAQEAIRIGLKLNDTYALDGFDPNGFVGVMWSVCGVHDQGWKERAIYGKIRCMMGYCLEKKYQVGPYIDKYNGMAKKKGENLGENKSPVKRKLVVNGVEKEEKKKGRKQST